MQARGITPHRPLLVARRCLLQGPLSIIAAGEAQARWPHLGHPCPQRHTPVWKSYPIRLADGNMAPQGSVY
jgi:hypothetical protein